MVAHDDTHGARQRGGVYVDAFIFGREFGGVAQQIGKHLGQPDRVARQQHWLLRQVDIETLVARLDERATGFDGGVDDVRQRQQRLFHGDFAAADAGGVEQVVHQPRQVGDLAADDALEPEHLGAAYGQLADQFIAIAIGCSGLRSSWASINRNSVFRRPAASALACKSCAPVAASTRLWLASRSCSSCVSLCSKLVFLRCRNSTCSSSSAITARNSSTSRRCRAWLSCPCCSAACAGVSEKSCSFWSTT